MFAHSIPKLELLDAILGLRLTLNEVQALNLSIIIGTFWADSLNVLWWIYIQSRRYKPFVANRFGEIHDCTTPVQWRYMPTKSNPADIASKGSTASMLIEKQLWWNGPDYLLEPEQFWPKSQIKCDEKPSVEEKRLPKVSEKKQAKRCICRQ